MRNALVIALVSISLLSGVGLGAEEKLGDPIRGEITVQFTLSRDEVLKLYSDDNVDIGLKTKILSSLIVTNDDDLNYFLSMVNRNRISTADISIFRMGISCGRKRIVQKFIEESRREWKIDGIVVDKEMDVLLALLLEEG